MPDILNCLKPYTLLCSNHSQASTCHLFLKRVNYITGQLVTVQKHKWTLGFLGCSAACNKLVQIHILIEIFAVCSNYVLAQQPIDQFCN